MRPILAALLVSLAAPTTAAARPGDPDPAFGNGGRVAYTVGASSARVGGLALRPDGGAVVTGSAEDPDGHRATSVLALTPAGALDTTFGTDATALLDGLDTTDARPGGVALTPDGATVSITTVTSAKTRKREVHVVRALADGEPDPAFGIDGVAVLDFEDGNVEGEDVAVDERGRVLVAASTERGGRRYMSAFRLTPNGDRDARFAGGRVDLNSRAFAGAILPRPGGGAYVAGGTLRRYGNITAVEVSDRGRRLDRFAGGRAAVRLANRTRRGTGARDMVFGPGGSLIIAADVRPLGAADGLAVVRLTPRGQLDRRFGAGGRFTAGRADRPLRVQQIVRDGHGRLVVAGSATTPATGARAALVLRLSGAGRADRSFGSGGAVIRRLGGAPGARFVDSSAEAVAVAHDRIWVGGVAVDDEVDPSSDRGRDWAAVMRLLG
jgi:uncharacterized delta-60 repeat protein